MPRTPAELAQKLPWRLAQWAPQFVAAELCYQVPAELLAAVCDRESGGGEYCKPKGPSGTGDGGHGHGLMQIDDRYHRSFLLARFDDSTYLWADPTFNIMRGARLLAKNQKRAGWWPASVAAYNAGLTRVMDALRGIDAANPVARMAAVDSVTTGKDYASDVFRRMAQFGGTV